ncbi:MogA/MoaB family molybdenum cofactor biosynthesis protein [Mesobacillus foraminis]|uniref:Molybdenum cofactor biosynthesis protein B n=1 Tax=Mesobacillus foraminis TaxID=279826 RepID=A0A4R2BDV2_9BACI|nr:molybdenum cofactor biosynthesis protein B [Mesobacillus foraminis]TCN24432.1 molybdenum cofactor biosynthesis protein B [Mesobacillus foraminis]
MSVIEHKSAAPAQVRCKIITISDTRNADNDKSGKLMKDMLIVAGHAITEYAIVKDDAEAIRSAVKIGCSNPEVDIILTNGGTGIAGRDVTIETLEELFDKAIPGFGELFRMLSYQEDIGSAAMMSRAAAGVCKNKAVFATPGSTGAVKLAMEKLILPEIGHVVRELKKDL